MLNVHFMKRLMGSLKKGRTAESATENPAKVRIVPRAEEVPGVCHMPLPHEKSWYPPSMLGPSSIASHIMKTAQIQAALKLFLILEPDEYVLYMSRFYNEGLKRFGSDWRYADIVTVLLTLSEHLQPRRYLEIGVRRGRSVCAVASRAPACDIVMFDMWVENYAGIENPGPTFVRNELEKVGHHGKAVFVNGNSHETLPQYFSANPDACFDLITVDGDHSDEGAAQDLMDVIPRLNIGGAVVFDDVSHPQHPGLKKVWRTTVVEDPRFTTWTYDEIGFGVGFGMRRW